MAQKKAYSRYFIILQEDEKGYSLGVDKSASGYVKMEIKNGKCKISYYVQNIKKESAPYYMVLICDKKDTSKIIKVGEMNIDEYGRADICYEYGEDNIANSNISADKVSGAAIVKFIDSNIISVMSGFSTTDIPTWKNFNIIESSKLRNEEKSEEKSEQKTKSHKKIEKKAKIEEKAEDKSIFDKYEDNIEKIKDTEIEEENNKKEVVNEQKIEENLDKEDNDKNLKGNKNTIEKDLSDKRNIEETEKEFEVKEECEVKEEIDSSSQDTISKEDDTDIDSCKCNKEDEHIFIDDTIDVKSDNYRDKEDYPKGVVGNFFNNLVEDFKNIENFNNEIKRCKWYNIPVKNKDDMKDTCNYDKYMVVYHPMINYYPYIEKYKHYVMGYKCDKEGEMKYLVYGIPGKKSKEDQPFEGKSGFVTWISDKDEQDGYWLMFYDYKTSKVIIPTNK